MIGNNLAMAFKLLQHNWRIVAVRSKQARRSFCTSAMGASAVGPFVEATRAAAMRLGSAMMVGGSAAVVFSQLGPEDDLNLETSEMPFVQQLAAKDSVQEVLSPGQMLRQHPIGKIIVDQDHLFEAMVQSGQIEEFRCFYDSEAKQFHSVVRLGREVCGYPNTVHGGLTAAIMDETLGGLGVCMWKAGSLGFRPPAFTARLEVDYKRKIPSGTVTVCSADVERIDGRKIWMKADVTNGEGIVYASARALFIAPRMQNVLLGWIPGWKKAQ